METVDVIVAGGGHAGLSISYYLCEQGISHIVFEKKRIGESWLSQRWDSFVLNTPNVVNVLPGPHGTLPDPGIFITGKQYAAFLSDYTEKNNLPVNTNSEVIAIQRDEENNVFTVTVKHHDHVQHYNSKQMVIASGAQSTYRLPEISSSLPRNIYQIHAAEYRNASQLPPGAVLVVGGAQSGCQIAEDLAGAHREVFLASSKVARIPRRYRNKDISYWLSSMKFFDQPTESVTDPQVLTAPTAQVSGNGKQGHTVSYQFLHSRGVRILGHFSGAKNQELIFRPDAKANVKFADDSSQMIKSFIDQFITNARIDAPESDADFADIPDTDCMCAENLTSLDLKQSNITTIVWCNGYSGDFKWIKVPVLDNLWKPLHKNGVSPVKGLFFLGFPWLRSRKSGIIYGIKDDALAISNEIALQSEKEPA